MKHIPNKIDDATTLDLVLMSIKDKMDSTHEKINDMDKDMKDNFSRINGTIGEHQKDITYLKVSDAKQDTSKENIEIHIRSIKKTQFFIFTTIIGAVVTVLISKFL